MRCFGVVPWFEARAAAAGRGHPRARGAGRGAGAAGAIRIAVPRLPRIANFDDLDPLRGRARRRARGRAAGGGAAGGCGSRDPAGLQGDARRSRGAARRGLGRRSRGACAARRRRARASAAGCRCWGGGSPIRRASRGRPAEADGLGLLELETTLGGGKRLVEVAGREVASGRAGPGLRDAHRAERPAPALARPMLELGGRAGRRGLGGRAGHGLLPARPVRGRRLPPRVSRTPAARGRVSGVAYEAQVEARARRAGRPSRGGRSTSTGCWRSPRRA